MTGDEDARDSGAAAKGLLNQSTTFLEAHLFQPAGLFFDFSASRTQSGRGHYEKAKHHHKCGPDPKHRRHRSTSVRLGVIMGQRGMGINGEMEEINRGMPRRRRWLAGGTG